ncbi:MAG: bifunctional 5,10-methylenetetrahydrofolate dehydrogenase/5,10-methenyltetrahydrofolate cyclohydrolase [Phycisphaerales bacterium]|nr:bifunctional 5,10-methylenetetrahydrofolate dehydrogenase/5,10-methenyltetrahydrofolate cyclohydrolase [Phycisphaerales bacterium]
MMTHQATLIDGKALAGTIRERVREAAEAHRRAGRPVRLDAILASDDSGAAIYARNQASVCEAVGIEYVLHELPGGSKYDDIAGRVLLLNTDDEVHAIMVHLPLPAEIDTERIQSLIDVSKDVEGVNPANIGRVVYGRRSLVPCTALAVMEMIESTGIALRGTRCVIVGASNIVGKPVAVLLMKAEATVISTNKYTKDLASLARTADVLVSAAGVPGLITADMVKPGAVVVDVGINRITMPDGTRRTVGDVAFDEVAGVAGHLSPVPGGVGPMTVAMLMRNTVQSMERSR